jgi:hypothetical protein
MRTGRPAATTSPEVNEGLDSKVFLSELNEPRRVSACFQEIAACDRKKLYTLDEQLDDSVQSEQGKDGEAKE